MAYKVFISYSTNDFQIVENVRKLLTNPEVEVFIAEYSVIPGIQLDESIVKAIKKCDLFVLLWSRNSKFSEYVLQEIGVARGDDKPILPIVLVDGLQLPGFIKDLKYLPAYREPAESLIWLQQHIFAHADKHRQTNAFVLLCLGGLLVWLFSQKQI
ncbi:toll/interleukin-1 receptor domain-containing protein [Candidatus Omnitrophota bacterium]